MTRILAPQTARYDIDLPETDEDYAASVQVLLAFEDATDATPTLVLSQAEDNVLTVIVTQVDPDDGIDFLRQVGELLIRAAAAESA